MCWERSLPTTSGLSQKFAARAHYCLIWSVGLFQRRTSSSFTISGPRIGNRAGDCNENRGNARRVQLRCQEQSKVLNYLECYGPRFFKRRIRWAEDQCRAGRLLQAELKIGSIVDFGCGIGTILQGMAEGGCRVLGLEHNAALARRHSPIPECIVQGDVAAPISLGCFEWAMSIEVAEHIPTASSSQLVANLTKHAERGIIFSAAVPGQRGTGHINCQPPSYWRDLFYEHQFNYNPTVSERLRRLMAECTRLAWLQENLMIFERKG